MKENKKFWQAFSVIALVVAVFGISIGFAAMSQTLNISGQVKVAPGNWQVEFTNAVFNAEGTHATATEVAADPSATPPVTAKPNLTGTTFSDYEIVLTQPGDKGTYTVTVENLGSIDAALTGVSWNTGTPSCAGTAVDSTQAAADATLVCNNVTYTVTWEGGNAIQTTGADVDLDAGDSKNIVITAEYDSNATQLPSAPVIITGKDLTLTYTSK